MRRYIALSLAAVMALSLSACGSKKTEANIELAEYKGLEVYESDIEVTDDEIEKAINDFCEAHKTTETHTDGKVVEADTVNIDYVGTIKVDGEDYEFPSGTSSEGGYDLDIDNSTFIDGFAEGLIGKKVGKTVTLKLQFPDSYTNTTQDAEGNEIELAGKKVTFKVTINSRETEVIPEFTNKFVKNNYGAIAKTTEEFEAYIAEQIQIGKFFSEVWDNYSSECKVGSYDSEEKESMIAAQNEQSEYMLSLYYQTNLDTYLEACKMSREDWDKKIEDSVEGNLKSLMIINKIAEENGLTVKTDSKDFKNLKKKYAQYYNQDASTLDNDDLVTTLTSQNVQKFVFDNKKVIEGERPTEETTEETTTAE